MVAEWKPGTIYGARIDATLRRTMALGLPIIGSLWQLGETDDQYETTKAAWQPDFQAIVADKRAQSFLMPWLAAKSTWIGGVTSVAIRAAQGAVVNGTTVFAGPDTDVLNISYRHHGMALALTWLQVCGATLL